MGRVVRVVAAWPLGRYDDVLARHGPVVGGVVQGASHDPFVLVVDGRVKQAVAGIEGSADSSVAVFSY